MGHSVNCSAGKSTIRILFISVLKNSHPFLLHTSGSCNTSLTVIFPIIPLFTVKELIVKCRITTVKYPGKLVKANRRYLIRAKRITEQIFKDLEFIVRKPVTNHRKKVRNRLSYNRSGVGLSVELNPVLLDYCPRYRSPFPWFRYFPFI